MVSYIIIVTRSKVVDFLLSNWGEIVSVAGAIHLLALAVVNLTPTPKDDEIYANVYKVIEKLAGIVTKIAKNWLSSFWK